MSSIFDILGPIMVGPSQFSYSWSSANRLYSQTTFRGAGKKSGSVSARVICGNRRRTWNR